MRRPFLILLTITCLLLPPLARAQNPINTVAGNGQIGDGSSANSAIIAGPAHLAMNSAGDLFIADTFNNRIRKVDHLSLNISTSPEQAFPALRETTARPPARR